MAAARNVIRLNMAAGFGGLVVKWARFLKILGPEGNSPWMDHNSEKVACWTIIQKKFEA
jgi:hypothetical protein